jgi:hypothetical protein
MSREFSRPRPLLVIAMALAVLMVAGCGNDRARPARPSMCTSANAYVWYGRALYGDGRVPRATTLAGSSRASAPH